MNNRLNFNRLLFILFLSFVSFLNNSLAETNKTSGQAPATTAAAAPPAPQGSKIDLQIESLKTDIKKNPQDIKKIEELAEAFYQKGDYEKTTLLLWKQIDQIDNKSFILLAKAHEKRKEPSEMIRALNLLIGKDGKNFEAYSMLGTAYSLQKKSKEALENFKKAIELNPKFEAAYLGVADLYEHRNPPNLYELRILYQDMIDNMGEKSLYLQKLCEINAQDDNTSETAAESCRQATLKDPKNANGFVNLGNSLKTSGKPDEGAAVLKKAAHDFPKSEFAQYSYAKILDDQKNTTEAMKYYKAGTEADSTAARSWLGLATTSFDVKKYDVALIAYKNACKYDKKNAVAFRRATTVLRNSKSSEWVGKFETASENCTF